MSHSSPWWQHWQRVDTAAAAPTVVRIIIRVMVPPSWSSLPCRCAGPAVMGGCDFATYALGWSCHRVVRYVGIGLVLPSCGSPSQQRHRGVPYLVVVLTVPHGRITSPAKSCATWFLPPPHSQIHSRCCWLASGGVTIEIRPHISMRGGAGRKRGVIRYAHS